MVYHSKNIRKKRKCWTDSWCWRSHWAQVRHFPSLCLGSTSAPWSSGGGGGAEDMSGPFPDCNSSSPWVLFLAPYIKSQQHPTFHSTEHLDFWYILFFTHTWAMEIKHLPEIDNHLAKKTKWERRWRPISRTDGSAHKAERPTGETEGEAGGEADKRGREGRWMEWRKEAQQWPVQQGDHQHRYRLHRETVIRDNQNMGAYSPALLPPGFLPAPSWNSTWFSKSKWDIANHWGYRCSLPQVAYIHQLFVFPVTSWIGLISIIIIIPVLGMEKKKKEAPLQLVTAITVGS